MYLMKTKNNKIFLQVNIWKEYYARTLNIMVFPCLTNNLFSIIFTTKYFLDRDYKVKK